MENKLTQITPTYRSFEPNQVLTSDQLNEFLNYFDDQDRLSRIFLSGTGIVSGFNVNYKTQSGGAVVVEITQGAGITTDGDLINLLSRETADGPYQIKCEPFTYTHFRTFSDAISPYKPYFHEDNGDGPQIPMQELLFGDEAVGATLLSELTDVSNKVVLLYLETYEDSSDACTGIDCDNLGIKHVRKLRALLVTRENADKILAFDDEFNQHYLIQTYLNLDDVAVQRVTVNETNSATFSQLRTSYLNAIQAENTVNRLIHGFETMLTKVNMQSDSTAITGLLSSLLGVSASIPSAYFQYRYDLLRDVTDAYNELKDLFLDSVCCCCPDQASFPKHLMLGMLTPSEEELYITKPYRHGFYKSPILSCEKQCTNLFLSQVKRVRGMLERYIPTESLPLEIKITPSSYRSALSSKAIPYYYNLDDRLLQTWSYDKLIHNKFKRNLSYRTTLLEQSGPIQFPLKYNLEPHNFLRIEGAAGNDYKVALDRISQLKDQYGLAFDVKALSINVNTTDTINIDDYECEFEDLNLMLDAWTQEHECILGKVSRYFSAFSTAVPGFNYLEEDYYYPTVKPYTGGTASATYTKGNAVLDNAYNADGALGKILVDKFLSFRGCSGRDIIAQVNRDLVKVPATKPAINEATLAVPTDVLSFAYVLLEKRPLVLPQITPGLIDTINTNVESLCSSARQGLVKFPAAEAQGLSSRNTKMLTTLTTDLTALCCSAEKLELIYDEIEKRKQEILLGLNLAKFQEQHPGLEHFAGTKQGGTFLMVYVGSQVGTIPANTVVADFTLPYLCCSDCKSVNFIVPKPPVSMRLSSNVFTIGESTSPIEIFATPSDGVVKFSPQVPGMTVNGNQLLIDGNSIPDSVIGQPITFTVNDQYTGVELKVYRSVPVTFKTNVDPNYITTNVVEFKAENPNGNPLTNFKFLWSFGDGLTSTEKSPTHVYKLPLSNGQAVVKLTATPPDGGSPSTFTKTLNFKGTSISIGQTQFCDNDKAGYKIAVSPPSSSVNISGPGVVNSKGDYFFNPSIAGAGSWTIYLNGNMALLLNVKLSGSAAVEVYASEEAMNITSNMQNVSSYEWTFVDAEGEVIHAPVTDVKNPVLPFADFAVEPGETIFIRLAIISECNTTTYTTSIVKPTSFEACSIDSADKLGLLKNGLEQLLDEGDFSQAAQKTINDVIGFYDEVNDDPSAYLSGSFNSLAGNRLSNYLHSLYLEINKTVSAGNSAVDTAAAYFNVMRYGLTLVRCQDEEKFMNKEIVDMISLVKTETDPNDSSSLQNIGINVDPESVNSIFLNAVLGLRQDASGSWNLVNGLLMNIQYNPAGE